ncbi:MAG: class I SAM-dependent methyltransferase [Microscillaceae bacterium]|nr:class I SAM-dependent methyltransferase [Microscillaceae bacterium]MDW8461071.1 class I SAM-dependent methyltransferase [Cytophagales bacterium]
MKKITPLYAFIYLLVAASCQQSTSIQEKNKIDERTRFLQFLDIFSDEEKLNEYIEKQKLSPVDIYQYCLKNQDDLVRARLIKAVYLSAKNNNKDAAKPEFWADLRYNMYYFTDIISRLREEKHKTFLDIGCGSGQKLYAALCMGFEKVYGIEYSKESYRYALEFLDYFVKNKKAEITNGDGLTIDGKYYAQADFLYTYSPIKENKMMAQMFFRAMQNLKENGILLEVRMVYAPELREISGYKIPNIKGFFAVKREKGQFFYKNTNSPDHWVQLSKN